MVQRLFSRYQYRQLNSVSGIKMGNNEEKIIQKLNEVSPRESGKLIKKLIKIKKQKGSTK